MPKVPLPLLLLTVFMACSHENRIDQTKFEKLFRAGKAIETLSSPNGVVFDEYLKDFDHECLAAKSLTATDAEREMVHRYDTASNTLKAARSTYEDMLSGTASPQEASDNWEYALFIVRQAGKWYEAGEIKSIGETR
jgi:predicted Abi (CAAX) family protease